VFEKEYYHWKQTPQNANTVFANMGCTKDPQLHIAFESVPPERGNKISSSTIKYKR